MLYLALPISGVHKDDVFWEGGIRHQDLIQLVIYHLPWNLQGQERLLGSPQGVEGRAAWSSGLRIPGRGVFREQRPGTSAGDPVAHRPERKGKEGDQERAKRGLRTQAGAPGAQLAVLPEQEGPQRVMKQGSRRGGGRRQQAGAHRMENEGNNGERTNESSKEAVWGARHREQRYFRNSD